MISAENGQQCIDALSRGGIHLAFIDVNMPEMSGMEALGKARTGGNKTFVTLMSANANQRRMQLAQQLRVYEFLAKPFSIPQLNARVHACLARASGSHLEAPQ